MAVSPPSQLWQTQALYRPADEQDDHPHVHHPSVIVLLTGV